MTPDLVKFGSSEYFLMLGLLAFSRGMDFLSTWTATPTLALEGNPLATKLGWKFGALLNIAMCVGFAVWPLTAITVATCGLLVAAHNFHSAWIMRSMGEEAYRGWFVDRLAQTSLPLFFFCLLGETLLTAIVGLALLGFSRMDSVTSAIGLGIVMYAVLALFFTTLAMLRTRRQLAAEVAAQPRSPDGL